MRPSLCTTATPSVAASARVASLTEKLPGYVLSAPGLKLRLTVSVLLSLSLTRMPEAVSAPSVPSIGLD